MRWAQPFCRQSTPSYGGCWRATTPPRCFAYPKRHTPLYCACRRSLSLFLSPVCHSHSCSIFARVCVMSSTSHKGLGALGGSFLGLSCIVVALRFYARNVQKAPLKMDDWAMLPGLVSTGQAHGPAMAIWTSNRREPTDLWQLSRLHSQA